MWKQWLWRLKGKLWPLDSNSQLSGSSKLFLLLQPFPIESKGIRLKKLQESRKGIPGVTFKSSQNGEV
uniref:Uncharacterized protein n=1 Tax=Triticum urartu TaxID=4572 RepID=A0A8R7U8L4_TRIUA